MTVPARGDDRSKVPRCAILGVKAPFRGRIGAKVRALVGLGSANVVMRYDVLTAVKSSPLFRLCQPRSATSRGEKLLQQGDRFRREYA